jgi:hypothetical protein
MHCETQQNKSNKTMFRLPSRGPSHVQTVRNTVISLAIIGVVAGLYLNNEVVLKGI